MFHTLRSPRVAASLLLLAVTAGASGTALGQDQPAVFVHGLTQTGNAWGFIAPQLQNQFQLRALHPTLGWQAPYELQASALHDSLAGLSGVAAIGHSNGGIVVRTYLNQYGSASRINRVLTVGSLHQGAPLAGHALNGAVEQWGANVFGSMSSAIGFYADNDPDWPNVLGQFGSDLAGALGVISWAFQNIGDVVAAIGFFVPSVALPPVLPEMVPGSGTFQTINASGNLQLESSITAYRVSIATTADEGRMPWALWTNNPGLLKGAWVNAMGFAAAMYYNYEFSDDPYLYSNAYRWKDMFFQLYYIPTIWQFQIGARVKSNGVFAPVAGGLNDGVVTWATADYPGQEARHPAGDISHIEQLSSSVVKTDIAAVLSSRFGFLPRGSSPPPPPSGGGGGQFAASLVGPTEIAPANACSWVASASGGSGSYTYQWSRNGSVVSSGSSYTGSMDGAPSFNLSVVVSDGNGSLTRSIVVAGTGSGECLQV